MVVAGSGVDRRQCTIWPYAAHVAGPDEQEDWDAVARAVQDRLDEMRATQMEIATRAGISLTTLRELQHNTNPRRRRPQTIAAVSEALGWPSGYLAQVLHGEPAQPHTDEVQDPVLRSLKSLETEIELLRSRIARVEQQLAAGDEQP